MEALIARSVHVLIALGGAYVLTLWFALVVWTFQDIQARSRNVVAQIFSTLVVMLFFLPGLLVYMILRPRYTLDDAFQRSLEEEYLLQDLEELPHCPGCQSLVEEDWVYCPNCRTELRDNCVACDRLIELEWEICPYCGTEQYGDPDEIPAQPATPVITPHQPAYGWLERTMAHHGSVHELSDIDQRTRPIIPATVRYDFRVDDGIAEPLDSPPVLNRVQPLIGLGAPHRVSFEQNGHVNGTHSSKTHVDSSDDHHAEDIETDDVSAESTHPRRDV